MLAAFNSGHVPARRALSNTAPSRCRLTPMPSGFNSRRKSISRRTGHRFLAGGRPATKKCAPSARARKCDQIENLERFHDSIESGSALACNLANLMRTLALPVPVARWSLTGLRENPVKIGAKIAAPSRYVICQMAEVAMARDMFAEILRVIPHLRAPPRLEAGRGGSKDKSAGGVRLDHWKQGYRRAEQSSFRRAWWQIQEVSPNNCQGRP